MEVLLKVFVFFDRLVNGLCLGNFNATVSGRIGQFSIEAREEASAEGKTSGLYWLICEALIDWAMLPFEENHCYVEAMDEQAIPNKKGNDYARAVMAIFVIIFALVVGILGRALCWVKELYGSGK